MEKKPYANSRLEKEGVDLLDGVTTKLNLEKIQIINC